MKLLLDNLFYLGQIASLVGLAWGAWLVLREFLLDNLCHGVCIGRKVSGLSLSLACCLLHPLRRTARV
jgi:hypothetical protein